MSSLLFKVKNGDGIKDAEKLVNAVHALAKKRGEYTPKRINFGGMYYTSFYVCYNRNSVRDLILEVAKKHGLKIAPHIKLS